MNGKLLALIVVAGLALEPAPAVAQVNNNAYTPLGSRIRKANPFPNEPRSSFKPAELNEAQKLRSRTWVDLLGRCMWNRSNEKGLDLLARTDFGFRSFEQIGLDNGQVDKLYPLSTCLVNVAERASSGITLQYSAAGLRSWYLQAAYFDRYADGPTWIRPGHVVSERSYPLSSADQSVQAAMNLADCVVVEDPHGADYLFRTAAGTAGEKAAFQNLIQAISSCIPQGQEVKLEPAALRLWIGEGLWHAANHSGAQPDQSLAGGPALATPATPLEQGGGQ